MPLFYDDFITFVKKTLSWIDYAFNSTMKQKKLCGFVRSKAVIVIMYQFQKSYLEPVS